MERRRIQWMGHVKRMGDNRMPRIALEKEERGRRPRGRWEDQVWKDIERRGLLKMLVEEEENWNDRQKWRRLCTTTRFEVYGPGAKLVELLGKHATVFQADIMAIESCAKRLIQRMPKGAEYVIPSNSQAALKLPNTFSYSKALVND
ncbi:hypothetical protein J6590_011346 [Homalodisca vitripennis]|nr:hypothetical protein J6590_011346 [Homalodisca vitripennis]